MDIVDGSMHFPAGFAAFTLARPEGSSWIYAAAAWFLVVLPACFAGLGLIARRLLGAAGVRMELLPALGLAAFVFAGGILNLARLAFPLSIWILLAAGLCAAAAAAWRRAGSRASGGAGLQRLRGGRGLWLPGCVAAGVMALTLAAQLAPRVYNWNDDLQKYFAHPVRMLETGTVFGSPLSAIGVESIGGMAFVHSCVLLWLPIRAINGADAILGLLLCLIPLLAYGWRHPGLRAVTAVAIASTVIIDPYYVNISALFLGSALMMATVILTGETDVPNGRFSGGRPATVGLVYAALVALKPTFLLFVGPHIVAVVCAVALAQASTRAGIRWGARAAAFTACFLAPWIVVHLPRYMALKAPGGAAHLVPIHQPILLLGAGSMGMGLTGLRAYTVLVAVLAALALACVGLPPALRRAGARYVGAAVAAAVSVAAYPFMLFAFPRIVGYADADPNAVRYFIPLGIGVFPIALCLAAQSLMERAPALPPRAGLGLCVSLGLAPLAFFSGTAAERYRDAFRYGTILPFQVAHEASLARQMDYALGSAKQVEIRSQQERIPPGSSLIAWINTPYLLDYSRNTIFDAEVAGIANRWGALPDSDYILWEYRGSPDPHARTMHLVETLPQMNMGRAAALIEFDRILSERVRAGTTVFRNDEFILARTANGRQ